MPKFHVSRSIDIDASPEKIFAVVSDFSTWKTWSPWLIAEPDANVTVSDDSASVGSSYAWDGQVTGAGEMIHRQLQAPERIVSEIRFLRPMQSVSQVSFDLRPQGSTTTLTWTMDGSLPWFMFWMVKMMDGWVGMDYERGLRMLKEWIETGEITSRVSVHGPTPVEAQRIVGVRRACPLRSIGNEMKTAIDDVSRTLAAAGRSPAGPLIAAYHDFNVGRQTVDFTVGYSIDGSSPVPEGLSEWSAPASSAFHVEHVGSYDHLGNGWSVAQQHVRYKRLKSSKVAPYEVYRNTPDDTRPADLRTDIYIPLRS